MKKYMNMPSVQVVRFDAKDIIVTSPTVQSMRYDGAEMSEGTLSTQERNSIW